MATKTTKNTKTAKNFADKADFLKKKPTKLEFLTRKVKFFVDKIQTTPVILNAYNDAMRCDMCDGVTNKNGTPKTTFGSISFEDTNKFTGETKTFKIHRICEECMRENQVVYTDWFAIRNWLVNHPTVSVSSFETKKEICQLCGAEADCLRVHVGIEKLAISVYVCQHDMDKIIIDDASLEHLKKSKKDVTEYQAKCKKLGIKAKKVMLFTNGEQVLQQQEKIRIPEPLSDSDFKVIDNVPTPVEELVQGMADLVVSSTNLTPVEAEKIVINNLPTEETKELIL